MFTHKIWLDFFHYSRASTCLGNKKDNEVTCSGAQLYTEASTEGIKAATILQAQISSPSPISSRATLREDEEDSPDLVKLSNGEI